MARQIYYQWWESETPNRYTARVFKRFIRKGIILDDIIEDIGDSISKDHLHNLVHTYYPRAKCINPEMQLED